MGAASCSTTTCPASPPAPTRSACSTSRIDLADAAGWTNVPASFSPAKQASFTHNNAQLAANGVWDVYIYDSTNDGATNYDRVLVVSAADGKNGAMAVADLAQGEWADAKVTIATGTLAGLTAGFYLKAIDLNADLSKFRLYFTSVQRANATYNALGAAGSTDFEEKLNRDFPTSTAADFAPLEAGIVDEDTYVEQGLMWKDAHWAYLEYILGPAPSGLGVKPDLLLVGTPTTDEFSHQFMGLSRRPTSTATRTRTTTTSRTTTSRTAASPSARATSARPTRRPTGRSTSPAT